MTAVAPAAADDALGTAIVAPKSAALSAVLNRRRARLPAPLAPGDMARMQNLPGFGLGTNDTSGADRREARTCTFR
jgi:hypothetical protein